MVSDDGEAAGMCAAAVPDDEILPHLKQKSPTRRQHQQQALMMMGVVARNTAGGEEPALPGAAGLVPHVVPGRRRVALPILDLEQLKSQPTNLKRQLRECTKSVKAQAWLLDRALAQYFEIIFLCRCRNKKGAACSKRLEI